MASQCYYGGDFYAATESVAAGQSPVTHPAKWRKLRLPHQFREYLMAEAAAVLMPGEGQHDKATLMKAAAYDRSQEAIVREATTNGRGHQPTVMTR
jgi:hypothetical protein